MCEGIPAGHPELWLTSLPHSRGPQGNVELWAEAEKVLDRMCSDAQDAGRSFNEGALCALTDAYNRCIEERRRAEDLLALHNHWSQRPIEGIQEPESPVRD